MGKSSYPYLALERNSIPSDLSPRYQKQPSDLAIRGTPPRSDGLDPKESAEAGAVQEAHGSIQGEDLTRVDEAKGSTVPPPIGRRERRDPLPILSIIPPRRGRGTKRERDLGWIQDLPPPNSDRGGGQTDATNPRRRRAVRSRLPCCRRR